MLRLAGGSAVQKAPEKVYTSEAYSHHHQLLEGYLGSHRIKNHAEKTAEREKKFLEGWFASHGTATRELFTWEAMEPQMGRKRILDYANALIESELSSDTVRAHLGILSRYFAYVLEHPYVSQPATHGQPPKFERLQKLYGPIDQPISDYDMPVHSYDGERLGVPLDPARLYNFYSILRKFYLSEKDGIRQSIRARNYAMAVLAGESGLRVDELLHLEIEDLFFDSKKVQTRFAKGTRGSGKRARLTLFPALARDTVRHYLKVHRPKLHGTVQTSYLFISSSGGILSYGIAHKALQEMIDCVNQREVLVARHFSWHWFRRIFATRFIEKFPNQLPVLLNLLGHMSPNTVHKYIRHSEAWMNSEIQKMLEGVDHLWASNGP